MGMGTQIKIVLKSINNANSSQYGQNSKNSKIIFMQHNTAKSTANIYTILQYGVETPRFPHSKIMDDG
jgi:cobalamin biosynthesis Co2+ chelatase CbiK